MGIEGEEIHYITLSEEQEGQTKSANTWHYMCGAYAAIKDRRVYMDHIYFISDEANEGERNGIQRQAGKV